MRRDQKRVTRVVALVMVFAMVALLGASLTVSGGQDATTTPTTASASSTSTSTTIAEALLSASAKELLALAASGRTARFHVAFTVTSDSFSSDVIAAALEVWRDGSSLRQDSSQHTTAGVTKSQTFVGPSGTVECLQPVGGAVTCRQVSTQPVADQDFVSGVELLVRTGAVVTATDDTVAGRPVRCFAADGGTPDNAASVCLTSTGAPVKLVTSHFDLAVTTVEDVVDDAVFSLPAPVTTTPAN